MEDDIRKQNIPFRNSFKKSGLFLNFFPAIFSLFPDHIVQHSNFRLQCCPVGHEILSVSPGFFKKILGPVFQKYFREVSWTDVPK